MDSADWLPVLKWRNLIPLLVLGECYNPKKGRLLCELGTHSPLTGQGDQEVAGQRGGARDRKGKQENCPDLLWEFGKTGIFYKVEWTW